MNKSVTVITTVGTSVLNDRANTPDVGRFLAALAHKPDSALTGEERARLATIERSATLRLAGKEKDRDALRLRSAELNGFYGLLGLLDAKEQASLVHYLVPTDTAPGRAAARVLQQHLDAVGMPPQVLNVEKLQVGNREEFDRGVTELLTRLHDIVKPERTRVIFNLVGGFKVLQVYLGVLSMTVGAESIYIFESNPSDLLNVQRLPIAWEVPPGIPPERLVGSMMRLACAAESSDSVLLVEDELEMARKLGALIVTRINEGWAHLSPWGKMWWDQVKDKIVKEMAADRLPILPHLRYTDEFKRGTQQANLQDKMKLFEVLAMVSVLLDHPDGLAELKTNGSIQYSAMEGSKRDHFRVTRSKRVMCHAKRVDGKIQLVLEQYGEHDVEN